MGRKKPVPKAERPPSPYIMLRVKPEERAAILAAAKADGRPVQQWGLRALLRVAQAEGTARAAAEAQVTAAIPPTP